MSHIPVTYRSVEIGGVSIFYREAGDPQNPTLLLLHGYPSSSFMFRGLIADLSDHFHLIAPDYPGFGSSDTPPIAEFAYTFDHLAEIMEQFLAALSLDRFSLYVQDYGAPRGLRLAAKHPEWIEALIVQNGNAYEEGFTSAWEGTKALWQNRNAETEAAVADFFTLASTRSGYVSGVRDVSHLSPDTWNLDQSFLDRPVNRAAQLELMYDYRSNLPLYPRWQEYFRTSQPRTLIVWGKGDPFFRVEGATAYLRDLPQAELHLLDTGHFALEEDGPAIAEHIRAFLGGKNG